MEMGIVVANFIFAVFGEFLTIALMVLGYKVLDWITPFDTSKHLGNGNIAIGIVQCIILNVIIEVLHQILLIDIQINGSMVFENK